MTSAMIIALIRFAFRTLTAVRAKDVRYAESDIVKWGSLGTAYRDPFVLLGNELLQHLYLRPPSMGSAAIFATSLSGMVSDIYAVCLRRLLLALSGVFLCGDGRTVDLDHLAKYNVIEHEAS